MAKVRVGDQEIEEDDLVRYAWATGNFLEERLDPLQLEFDGMFDHMSPRTKAFILEGRKNGKSYGLFAYADKIARRKREAVIRFVYPTKVQGKEITGPIMDELFADCPEDLRWVNREHQEACWRLPHTGARLYFAGTDDKKQIDRLRGPKSDLVILDEVTTFEPKTLMYLIDSVLWPQTLITGGLTLMSGTPPTSLDHPSVDLIQQAKLDNTLVIKTIFDNPRLTPDIIRQICIEANKTPHEIRSPEEIDQILAGLKEGTPAWEREFMCRMVPDKDARVTPEFKEELHVKDCYPSHDRIRYVFMDAGHVRHLFGAVFVEVDFYLQTLFVYRDYGKRKQSTGSLKEQFLEIEKSLGWDKGPTPQRFLDKTAAQQIYDFTASGYYTQAGPKSPGKGQLVVDLRNLLEQDRIVIHPSCKILLASLLNGVWKDTVKEDFRESEALGHLDVLDALAQCCLLLRNTGKWQIKPKSTSTGNDILMRSEDGKYTIAGSQNSALTNPRSVAYTIKSMASKFRGVRRLR